MFIVEVGSVLVTGIAIADPSVFAWLIAVWLWFTVAVRQLRGGGGGGPGQGPGRGAAADARRDGRPPPPGRRLARGRPASSALAEGDVVVVSAGEVIPADGEVIEGIASIDESAITGESAPVIRESGGDRSAVTGGTRVLSDQIVVRVTQRPGESFLDRMIALVEGSSRQKTPNEIALDILLVGLTAIFLLAVVTLQPFAIYSGDRQDTIVLVALLVCLIPTTIGALLSAIGIAGMDRLVRRNVLALSGRAVEAAGDCSTLLLDKTGTITLGNRQAAEFLPLPGVLEQRARRRRAAREPRRRDARGPLDRRPGQGALPDPRARARRRDADPVHRADADERRRHARPLDPEGRRRRDQALGRGTRTGTKPRSRRWSTGSRSAAARRSSSPRTATRSASSTSRTWSRRACASASTSCGRWGSAP